MGGGRRGRASEDVGVGEVAVIGVVHLAVGVDVGLDGVAVAVAVGVGVPARTRGRRRRRVGGVRGRMDERRRREIRRVE